MARKLAGTNMVSACAGYSKIDFPLSQKVLEEPPAWSQDENNEANDVLMKELKAACLWMHH